MASSKDKLKKIIRELLDEMMNETSTSGGAGAFMTPNAFTGGKSANEKKRKSVATMFGMKLAPTKKNKKEDKAGLMEHVSDNELQSGYVTRKAFSGNTVGEKKRAVERSTVLGYQLMQTKKNEEFFDFEGDELLNEELIDEDHQINRDLALDLPDAKDQIKVDLPENSLDIDETEIIRKVQVDPNTNLPIVSKTAKDMASLKPGQKGKIGGKDVVIDTDKTGQKIAQQVKIVSQR